MFKKLGVLPEPPARGIGARLGQSGDVVTRSGEGSGGLHIEFADVAATYKLHPGDNRPYARVKIGDEFLDRLLDSGANVTVLGFGGHERVKRWELPIIETKGTIRTAAGTIRRTSTCVDVPYEFEKQVHVVRTYLLEHITKPLN